MQHYLFCSSSYLQLRKVYHSLNIQISFLSSISLSSISLIGWSVYLLSSVNSIKFLNHSFQSAINVGSSCCIINFRYYNLFFNQFFEHMFIILCLQFIIFLVEYINSKIYGFHFFIQILKLGYFSLFVLSFVSTIISISFSIITLSILFGTDCLT